MFHGIEDRGLLQLRLLVRAQHEGHATSLTSTFRPLLAGLDPELTYIDIMTPLQIANELPGTKMDFIETLACMNCSFNRDHDGRLGRMVDGNDDTSSSSRSRSGGGVVQTPALSVMLFLRETGAVSAAAALKQLQKPPWSFHHKIELSNLRGGNLKVIGRQEFYSCDVKNGGNSRKRPQPLWAICPVHCGTEHLRFTIFTQHFSEMVDFYRLLVGHEAEFTRTNFCLFTVIPDRGSGRDVQLAIKKSERLEPVPLSTAFLTFQIPNVQELEGLLHAPNGSAGTLRRVGDKLWLMRDPDSNCILVQEAPKVWQGNSVSPTSPSRSISSTGSTSLHWTLLNSTRPFVPTPNSISPRKHSPCAYTNNPQIGYLKQWATSDSPNHQISNSLMRNGQKHLNLLHLPNMQWTDLSSWDSGWQSGRSDLETAESVSAFDDTETETGSSSSGVFLCDCDVASGQGCVICCDIKSVPVPRQTQTYHKRPLLPTEPSRSKTVQSKRKPWEVDTMDLSMREWDDILSLSGSNDFGDVQGRSKIDAALNNLNLNQFAYP